MLSFCTILYDLKMSFNDNSMAFLGRFPVQVIRRQLAIQFEGGWPLLPPAVCTFSQRDTRGFIRAVQTIIEATQDRGWFRHNPPFVDHLTFYARLYRAALECICGLHNGTAVTALSQTLLRINPFDCVDLYLLDSTMTFAGIFCE